MPRTRMIFAAVAAIVAGLGGWWALSVPEPDRFDQCRPGPRPPGLDKIGGPFTLVSETGETVTERDVVTGPSLLYFGYSFCPDVCPLDNTRNAQATYLLDERGVGVTPVFISVDPDRDTPELMEEFTEYMHPRMIGLTGTPKQVQAASRAYRTFYKVRDPEDEFYLIDHSTFTYLVFPGLGVVDYFERDVGPEDMADRVECYIRAVN
ncbi:protein SCO1/2 [Rhodovulum imhoffii]|uniref:Protein SCO1/2 n=1 Tax=Rhodovulum imhoffii TaxID=365340 RepID=A0A2T5BRM7_9RHOB|nr:SCO family protein [Rhodovulum imhoffii]MBK5934055.1 SCO family protein [Rhodovulum imhoffii]PTN01940.1 protein SCO1/2 [Rhodovulum imhoffii]